MTRLRLLCDEKEESIADLARNLNAPQTTVGKWVRDEREMDYETLIRIADYFGVSLDYLLKRDFDLSGLRDDEHDLLVIYRGVREPDKKLLTDIAQLLRKRE